MTSGNPEVLLAYVRYLVHAESTQRNSSTGTAFVPMRPKPVNPGCWWAIIWYMEEYKDHGEELGMLPKPRATDSIRYFCAPYFRKPLK